MSDKHTGMILGENRKWEIQYGGLQTESIHSSDCRRDRNEIPTDISMFLGSSYPMRSTGMLYYQTGNGKSNMAASKEEVHISACRCNGNESSIKH